MSLGQSLANFFVDAPIELSLRLQVDAGLVLDVSRLIGELDDERRRAQGWMRVCQPIAYDGYARRFWRNCYMVLMGQPVHHEYTPRDYEVENEYDFRLCTEMLLTALLSTQFTLSTPDIDGTIHTRSLAPEFGCWFELAKALEQSTTFADVLTRPISYTVLDVPVSATAINRDAYCDFFCNTESEITWLNEHVNFLGDRSSAYGWFQLAGRDVNRDTIIINATVQYGDEEQEVVDVTEDREEELTNVIFYRKHTLPIERVDCTVTLIPRSKFMEKLYLRLNVDEAYAAHTATGIREGKHRKIIDRIIPQLHAATYD